VETRSDFILGSRRHVVLLSAMNVEEAPSPQ